MGRTKERKEIHHEPSTHEIFGCLSSMPKYSEILSIKNQDKPYTEFLKWLVGKDFYNSSNEKITVKKMASDFKSESSKITKWIHEIYDDIFELNYDEPTLFQKDGVKVALYMKHYDDACTFFTSLPVIPRQYETVRFHFVQAKMGLDYYWVKKVEHAIEDGNAEVTLWLQGGFLNKYREFALDKALFQGWIHFMDVYHKQEFELDEEIKKIYRN